MPAPSAEVMSCFVVSCAGAAPIVALVVAEANVLVVVAVETGSTRGARVDLRLRVTSIHPSSSSSAARPEEEGGSD